MLLTVESRFHALLLVRMAFFGRTVRLSFVESGYKLVVAVRGIERPSNDK
jgi:hypothetical protein